MQNYMLTFMYKKYLTKSHLIIKQSLKQQCHTVRAFSFTHAFNTSGYQYGRPFDKSLSIKFVYSKQILVTWSRDDKKLLINDQFDHPVIQRNRTKQTRSNIFQLTLRKLFQLEKTSKKIKYIHLKQERQDQYS